jgi:glyoxylase-like metal-dependent hydrolase (beta-lactamase superfamily II)
VVAGDWRRVNLSFVSAYILIRGGETAIVDLGTPGSGAAIEAGLKAAGTGWNSVRHVILTHRHQDHAGGLADVGPKATAATVYGGAADVGAITSSTPLKALNDGDDVFGLRIIGTPGHTAGHIAVFDASTGVLVAGDALRTTQGLAGPDPRNTANMVEAAASVKKMATLDVKVILPGHGAPLTTGAAEALAKLAAAS